MTDQELIRSLTEDFAPRVRELCADDKMDCDNLCAGNILTAKCVVFQAAERIAALQSENGSKDKEIERLEMQVKVKDACISGKSSIIARVEAERDALLDRAHEAQVERDCARAERDAAVESWRGFCSKCIWKGKQRLSDGQLDGRCKTCCENGKCNWEWRGAQGEA